MKIFDITFKFFGHTYNIELGAGNDQKYKGDSDDWEVLFSIDGRDHKDDKEIIKRAGQE